MSEQNVFKNKDEEARLIGRLRATAETKRLDAGMSGAWGDGGADQILDQIAYFQYGQRNEVPPAWREPLAKIRHEIVIAERQRARLAAAIYLRRKDDGTLELCNKGDEGAILFFPDVAPKAD